MKHSLLNRFAFASIIAFVFSLLITAQSFAAVDMFLEIEGVSGEIYKAKVDPATGNIAITNVPAGHYKMRLVMSGEALSPRMKSADGSTTPSSTIEISSFSWGISNSNIGSQSSGAGAGKVQMSDISIMKPSPKPSAVTKVAISGSGEELPKESISVQPSGNFNNKSFPITVRKAGSDQKEYYVIALQDLIISGSAAVKAGYEVKANVKM